MKKPTNFVAFCRGLLVTVAMLVATAAFAQNVTVKGKVVDDAGYPLPGTGVLVEGTTSGTVTDIDGNFELTAQVGAKLVISSIGYTTQTVEVPVGGGMLNITLHEDSELLSEVVVTAYGQVKQSKQVGYATARVDAELIERANVINPVNALQGKVAGMQIDAGGASGVTSSSAITIRGAKSLDKNNSPIWVIDGMIIQEPVTGVLDGGDWGSQLKNLNPADYESVTVLKGAAATALYGSRGANGAIVIVSKSGKGMKSGIGVEINETVEWTNIYKAPADLQNVYGAGSPTGATQGGFNADGTLAKSQMSWGPKMDGRKINQYLPHGQETPFVAHPDNWKEMYQTGLNNTTNIAISGGGEKSSFRLSYGYMDNKGVFRRNEFDRHNVSFRGNTDLNDIFSVEIGIQYAFSKALNNASQGGWDWGNNAGMLATYYLPRNYDYADHIASYRDENGSVRQGVNTYSALTDYLWNRDMNTRQRNETSILADVTLRAHLTNWLDASVKSNYNYYGYNYMYKGYAQNLNNAGGYGYERQGQTEGNYNFLAMLATKEFQFAENFTVRGNLAGEIYGNTAKNWWKKNTVGGFIVPGVFAFSNSAKNMKTEGGYDFTYTPRNQQTTSLFGIVNLGWKDQIFLELTARNDWLSTLTYPTYVAEGMSNYSVFYPSANASWVFSDTFDLPEVMSLGKFRASIARVGMGTSAYATVKGYGIYEGGSIQAPDGSSVSSFNPNIGTAFNPNLKPEIQQSIELGFDLRFFKDRLNLDAAYYKTNTYNQILSVSSTTESGASSMLINAGNIQNQGVEIALEAIPVLTKDWHWSVGANFSLNRGKIKKLHDDVKEINFLSGYDGAPAIKAYEGGAFGVLVNEANSYYGSPVWYDDQGRMVIEYAGAANSIPVFYAMSVYDRNEEGDRDAHIIGKVEPDFLLSLNTSLSYKNLDLYIAADGRFGGNFYSNMWKYGSSIGTFKSTLKGRDKEYGGIQRIDNSGNTVYNGFMIENAVFGANQQAPRLNPDGTLGEMMDVSGMTYADAVAAGMAPTTTGAWYQYNYGWGMMGLPGPLQDNTWFALREVTLGYRMPEKICKYVGTSYLRLGVTCRNVCYIINKLTDGLNPQSISSNNPLTPMDIGAVPFYRTFAFNVTARF